MNLPVHYDYARPAWRFAAGFINFVVFGLICMAAELVANKGEFLYQMMVLGSLTVFWLFCVLRKRSFGGACCLLEVRRSDFSELALTIHFLRTIPFYVVGLICLFPVSHSSLSAVVVQSVILLLSVATLFVNAVFLLFTGRSLIDRWLKLTVLRLYLPDQLRPRIFGIRIL